MYIAFLVLISLFPDSISTVVVQSSQKLFLSAVSITSSSTGILFIADQADQFIFELSEKTLAGRKIGGRGWGDTEFDSPCDIASSFLLDVFVVDRYNYRIQKYDKALNLIQSYNENSIENLVGRFQPISSAASSRGDLFVIETDENRILKINRQNKIENEFGTYKEGNGALVSPKDIAITSTDIIAVLDQTMIKLFDVYGNYLRSIQLPQNEIWKSVQPYNESIIAVSESSIAIYTVDGFIKNKITTASIIGLNKDEKIQDALITSKGFYILTPTTLYAGYLVN